MIIDLLRTKKLLGKTQSEIETNLRRSDSRNPVPERVNYEISSVQPGCGNMPQLDLELVYRDNKVTSYRAAYHPYYGWLKEVTAWIE